MGPVVVVDNSIVMAWCLDDEPSSYARVLLERMEHGTAIQPSIWPLELGNALVVAERRNRITREYADRFLEQLSTLSIEIQFESMEHVVGEILTIARKHQLSTYDASYLDLAMRREVPLATQDKALIRAAAECGVTLFQP